MTMLDRMRRHRGWLKWSLALVVLAFIFFYIPDFLQTQDAAAPNAVVARVGDQEITAAAFRRAYLSQLQSYQRAYGGSINEQLLKQMGIEKQILQQLIDERAAIAEAERLGLAVSDAEVAQRIYVIPAFQQNGQFAGQQALRAGAADAAAPAHDRGVRGEPPERPARREAARGSDRLGGGVGRRTRARVPPAQRKGEAADGRLHARRPCRRTSRSPMPR